MVRGDHQVPPHANAQYEWILMAVKESYEKHVCKAPRAQEPRHGVNLELRESIDSRVSVRRGESGDWDFDSEHYDPESDEDAVEVQVLKMKCADCGDLLGT